MQILIIDKKACYSLYLSLPVRSSIRYISPSHSVNVNHERGNNFKETFRIAANDNQPSIPFLFLLFFFVLLCCCFFFSLFVLFFFEKVQERTISRPQNTLKRIVFLLKKANSKPLILLWILNLLYFLIIIEKLETTYSLNYQSL